jgi:uncharacterized protein YukE
VVERARRELATSLAHELEMLSHSLSSATHAQVRLQVKHQVHELFEGLQGQMSASFAKVTQTLKQRVETLVQERMTRLAAEVRARTTKARQPGAGGGTGGKKAVVDQQALVMEELQKRED